MLRLIPSRLTVLATMSLWLACPALGRAAESVSLAGPWRFALDRADIGVAEGWARRSLAGTITLPGDLAERGIGDEVTVETEWTGSIFDRSYFTAPEYAKYREPGNIKIPFWLQPDRHYVGPAWYQRDVEIPATWADRRLTLLLERAHWKTRAWVDAREVGSNDSLSTPHEYDLGTSLTPGRHTLTVRVDNRCLIPIGVNSHSISDHTQGNWNGLVGRLELRATALEWVEELQVYPNVASRSVTVRGRTGHAGAGTGSTKIVLKSASAAPLVVEVGSDGAFRVDFPLRSDAALWDEFGPALHQVTAMLANGESQTVSFGLREITTDGTQFSLNGRRIFLRGTLECAIFPKTGHPPTDVPSWRRILEIVRGHGLNHLRFHSWCPPEAAFVAADEVGVYLQVEVASWPNQGARVGDGEANDAWSVRESDRILRAYGNHPSFLLMASGNEPAGAQSSAWLTYWLTRMKALDARRLYTSSAGWPELPANQYHVLHQPRMHQWLDQLRSRINALPPETRTDYREFVSARQAPVVSHEIGQWCVYPNFDEIPKYTGYLKARNFEVFRETLAEHGLAAQARAFLHASGKLQALCYKEEIESALRTPGMGGLQLLDLHDFPGQGTALVGVLDAFWDEKGYVSAAEYRRFAGPTVPLARLAKRVFTVDEMLQAEIEVTHYGARPLAAAAPTWQLVTSNGSILGKGTLPAREIPLGSATRLGEVTIPLAAAPAPVQAKLVVTLPGADATNDWDVWIYPRAARVHTPRGVVVADRLDDELLARLEAGATVFLSIPPAKVKPDPKRGPIALGFSSIFWNTAWTNQQAPHTLGILCDPKHPALALFPTEAHSNWQWWYPVMSAAPMILDGLPQGLRPIVQVIDDWVTARKLGLVFEARVGKGKLLVTSIDLTHDDNPVSRQLTASLLNYLGGAEFAPRVALTRAQLGSF